MPHNRMMRCRSPIALASILVGMALSILGVLLPLGGAQARELAPTASGLSEPQVEPLTWLPSRTDGFDGTASAATALAEHGGHLYAGMVAQSSASALIWVLDAQLGWSPSSQPGFGGQNTGVLSLASVDGVLYAGTRNLGGAQVWSSGGEGWSHAADAGFGDAGNESIPALTAFQGRLYAGTHNSQGAQIWAYDGQQWRQVVSGGLTDPQNVAVSALAEYDGTLYAGTRNGQGAQVWSSIDGDHWSVVATDGFGLSSNVAVTALASAHTRLYAAVDNAADLGGEVWAYHAWTGWQRSASAGFASPSQPLDRYNRTITSLASHDGMLYAGTSNDLYGTQIWFTDGYDWWPSTKTGLGIGNSNRATAALAAHDGVLWAGTENAVEGAAVWRGQPLIGLAVSGRQSVVTVPNNLQFEVQVVNRSGETLVDLEAFDFWESTGECLYDPGGQTHLRWFVGDLGPGQAREHQFALHTHSWCETQVVQNTVRLQGTNLAPMFAFASSEVLAAPTPTDTPLPSPTPRVPIHVSFQQGADGFTGALDTHLDQVLPSTHHCDVPRIRVGSNQGLAGLVRFDLSAIPHGADVVSATLHLYGIDWAIGRDIQVGAYVISRTVDVCQANWSYARVGERWGNAGCQDTQTDRRAEPEITFWTAGLRHAYALEVTGAVRGWVDGSLPNNGLLLLGDANEREIHAFASGHHAVPEERPKLAVAYYPPMVPSPTATRTPSATVPASPTATSTPTSSPTSTATPICPDAFEPNDRIEEAWDVGWGGQLTSYICSPGDVDFYRADIGQQPRDGFSIALRDLPADYDLWVYDMAQQVIGASTNSGTQDEDVVVAAKQVYVKVASSLGAYNAQQNYLLEVLPVQFETATPTSTLVPNVTPTATQTLLPSETRTRTPTEPLPSWQVYLPILVSVSTRR